MPAGDYDITPASTPDGGRLSVILNRNDPPLESVALGHGRALRFRLPVPATTISLRVDAAAEDGEPAFSIRPAQPDFAANAQRRLATRAARYGHTRVFAFDEQVYLEPKGFWSRAGGRATIVIDPDTGTPAPRLAVTAGAVPTTVGVSSGRWSVTHSLAPGERRVIDIPATDAAWWLVLESGAGFRPFEREPGNPDVRHLAAWWEIP
jgi:hypothetical protein